MPSSNLLRKVNVAGYVLALCGLGYFG